MEVHPAIEFNLFVCAFFLFVELSHALRRGLYHRLVDRYTLCFVVSLFLSLFSITCMSIRSGIDKAFVLYILLVTGGALTGVLATFFLGRYVGFRGVIVLFRLIVVNEEHPAYLSMKKVTSSRALVNFLSLFVAFILNIHLLLASVLGFLMLFSEYLFVL